MALGRLGFQRAWGRTAPRRTARGPRSRRLAIDHLEARCLLAATPITGDLKANTEISGDQFFPGVITTGTGDAIVAWQSLSQYGVFFQRYSSTGTPLGDETVASENTLPTEFLGGIAADAVGNFVMAWTAESGGAPRVFARRFNSSGVGQGNEFRVDTSNNGAQYPTVAMAPDGDFVVTWYGTGTDDMTYGVYARRYSPAGASLGTAFRVNQTTAGEQRLPVVAMDASDNFVVVWESAEQDGSGAGIVARRYNGAGTALGNEFVVNTSTAGDQTFPDVAVDPAGDFVVSWHGAGTGGSGNDVYARRYNSAGAAQGGETRVNATLAGSQTVGRVSLDAAGNFVVTWYSDQTPTAGLDVYARQFKASGLATGPEFRVNVTTIDNQSFADVALEADGDFIVAWSSLMQDGSGYGVYSRRYRNALQGDANGDGVVGAADYAVWAAQFGQSTPGLRADFDANGNVGTADYALWAANFGNSGAGSASGANGRTAASAEATATPAAAAGLSARVRAIDEVWRRWYPPGAAAQQDRPPRPWEHAFTPSEPGEFQEARRQTSRRR